MIISYNFTFQGVWRQYDGTLINWTPWWQGLVYINGGDPKTRSSKYKCKANSKLSFFQLILMGGKERAVQHLYWILALRRVNGLMQRVQPAGATSVKEDYRKSVPRKWQISFQLHLFEPLSQKFFYHLCKCQVPVESGK